MSEDQNNTDYKSCETRFPVVAGSMLHRLLQRVARAVAQRLMANTEKQGAAGSNKKSDKPGVPTSRDHVHQRRREGRREETR